VLRILSPGGGYILHPDQTMLWPEENYRAMVEAARTYGRYPLDLPDE